MSDLFQGLFCIFGGCVGNGIAFEQYLKLANGSAVFITFVQFLTVVALDFYQVKKQRKIPLFFVFNLAVFFFTSSYITTKALDYELSMPMHIIFRSSGLAASLALGLLLKKSYSIEQMIGAAFVTVGLIIVTFGQTSEILFSDWFRFYNLKELLEMNNKLNFGYVLIFLSLFLGAGVGHFQEYIYKRFGKHTEELKFYSHLFSLPMFFLYERTNISDNFSFVYIEARSKNYKLLLWLSIICFTSYLCISGALRMSAVLGAVSLNFLLTLRKFISLMLSLIIFNNEFLLVHLFGSILVFTGAIVYSIKFSDLTKKRS